MGRCVRPGVGTACHADLCDAESGGEREVQVTLEREEELRQDVKTHEERR